MGAELGRRWLAALALAPESERDAIVEAVERQMVEEYGDAHGKVGADSVGGEDRA